MTIQPTLSLKPLDEKTKALVYSSLNTWKKVYSYFSEDLSLGEHVCDLVLRRIDDGIAFLVLDERNVLQGIARCTLSYKVLRIEELCVAPWNCASLKAHFIYQKHKIVKDPTFSSLVVKTGVDAESFLVLRHGVGRFLVSSSENFARGKKLDRLEVSSLHETVHFYHKVGFSVSKIHPLAFYKLLQ
jgi:hypothetical protein